MNDSSSITGRDAQPGLIAINPSSIASPVRVVESASQSTFTSFPKKGFKSDTSTTCAALEKKAIACIAAPNRKITAARANSSLERECFMAAPGDLSGTISVDVEIIKHSLEFLVYIEAASCEPTSRHADWQKPSTSSVIGGLC